MRARTALAIPLALTLALGLASCGEDDDDGDAGGGAEVTVTGTDKECTPGASELAAGKTTFVFTNKAGDVNELYIFQGTKVVKEVENVITGATKKLTVTLEAGKTYKVTCKPGQKGDGISADLTVK